MKKITYFIIAAMLVVAITACGNRSNAGTINSQTSSMNVETKNMSISDVSTGTESNAKRAESITITCLNGTGEQVEVTVPYNPQRIAVVDMAALDILDNLGLGSRIVGSSSTALDYLQAYVTDDSVAKLGTIKEADMEALMECEPDIIFMGGRMAESYDKFSEIAPVVRLTTDSKLGVLESTRRNAETIASIFGKEMEVGEKFADFNNRIDALRVVSNGKTAVVGMCTNGGFNVVGNGGRCSVIGVEVGFENLCNDTASSGGNGSRGGNEGGTGSGSGTKASSGSAHGNEASFELVVSLAPDYIFVMDRDAAIGTNGAKLAKEIRENELIMSTDAYKNGNLVVLEHPGIWYTAEGGITSFGIMLSDLETALLNSIK